MRIRLIFDSIRQLRKSSSWVWRWATKRSDTAGNVRVYCSVLGCSQKKGWAYVESSTTNIRKHLSGDHKLTEHHQKDGTSTAISRAGSIETALANLGKRNVSHYSTEALERQVCKVLVHHKLPYTIVESPALMELLHIAQAAPSADDIKLPSNDTITRRVRPPQSTIAKHTEQSF